MHILRLSNVKALDISNTKALLIFVLIAACLLSGCGSSRNTENSGFIKTGEIPKLVLQAQTEALKPYSFENAVITRVVDGDTLEADVNGTEYKVRLLCVDTPESVKEGVPVQAFSKEASSFTQNLVLNQKVKLVFDEDLWDKYNRLLAYVLVKDNYFLNALLVRNGYARVEIVYPNSRLAGYFYNLQRLAVDGKKGLWGLPKDKQPFVLGKGDHYIPRYYN